MRHARKGAKLTTALGIVTMFFGAMLVLAPGAGAVGNSGNLSCTDLLSSDDFDGITEVKDDHGRTAPYPSADPDVYATVTANGISIDYKLDSTGVTFKDARDASDGTVDKPIYAVFIKQGSQVTDKSVSEFFSGVTGGFVAYTEGTFSHITFCHAVPDGDPPGTGSLSVDKVLAGNNAPAQSTLFGFTVSCTSGGNPVDLNGGAAGNDATFTLAADAAQPHAISDIPAGSSCTVTETNTNNATSVSILAASVSTNGATRSGIVIGAGTTAAVVVTNTFTSNIIIPDPDPEPEPEPVAEPAGLTVVKSVAGEDAPADWSFPFTITNLGGVDLTDDDPDFSESELTAGNYTITETAAGDADLTDITCSAGADVLDTTIAEDGSTGSVTVALDETDAVTCTFTNTFPDVQGSVVVNPPTPAPAAEEPAVLGEQVVRTLPRTGSTNGPLAVLGVALLLAGATLVGGSRLRLRYLD